MIVNAAAPRAALHRKTVLFLQQFTGFQVIWCRNYATPAIVGVGAFTQIKVCPRLVSNSRNLDQNLELNPDHETPRFICNHSTRIRNVVQRDGLWG
jgi:hypothetical protein